MYTVQPRRIAQTLLVSLLAVSAAAVSAQADSSVEILVKTEPETGEMTVEETPGAALEETVPAAAPTEPIEADPVEAPAEVKPVEVEPDVSTEMPEDGSPEDGSIEATEPIEAPVDGTVEATEPIDTTVLTVVEVAGSSDAFQTLTAALEAAELTEQLSGEGPFTVFAPTDEAFAALPEGTLEALLLPENKAVLTQILSYHVLPEAVVSTDLVSEADDITTVEGSDVTLSVVENSIYVNEAAVLLADIPASNGVVHIIDQVIIPPELLSSLSSADAEETPEVSEAPNSSTDAEL
ncbi:MAG: fasciclin domain-containing protein [Cyanobacteria bacterium J06648_16]